MTPQTTEKMIDDLLCQLADVERSLDLSAIHQLENEAVILNQAIRREKEYLSNTMSLFRRAVKALRVITAAVEAFEGHRSNAEHAWGRYWGIYEDCEDMVFEMESLTP